MAQSCMTGTAAPGPGEQALGGDGGAGDSGETTAGAGATRTAAGAGETGTAAGAVVHPPRQPVYETVLSDAQLDRWIERIEAAELVGFDTETTSLDPMRAELVGLSLSITPWEACYVPVAHAYAGAPDQLAR